MDLSIKNLWIINIGGREIWITESIRNTWIIMAVLIGLAIFVRIKLRSFKDVPRGFQNIVEIMVETFDSFVHKCVGKDLAFLGNWFFMVASFLFISNISGMIPMFRAPTSDWSITVSFAIATFLHIQIMGAVCRKGDYFKSFLKPVFLSLPLNIIGEMARPISLSFRLFGNVLAGTVLMTLYYNLMPIYGKLLIPSALHFYFDLVSGALQAYIFTILSLSFIAVMAEKEEA